MRSRSSTTPISTFTLTFEDATFSEAKYAADVAKQIGSRHHEILLSSDRFAGEMEAALATLDQPTFDGLNSYFISRAVREAGLTVALVGTGGDELFGGYESFGAISKLLRLARLTRFVPRRTKYQLASVIARLKHRGQGAMPPQTRWAKLPDFLAAGDDAVDLYQLAYALFRPQFVDELLGEQTVPPPDHFGLALIMQKSLRDEIAGMSDLAGVSRLEQRLFLGERLLRDTDAASMAVALETRLPLVDVEVLRAVNDLPDDVRFMPLRRKQALRDAGLTGLTPETFDRPKSGFVMPFESWIRRELAGSIEATLNDESLVIACGLNPKATRKLWQSFASNGPGLYWSRVWAVYVLLRYAKRHGLTTEQSA